MLCASTRFDRFLNCTHCPSVQCTWLLFGILLSIFLLQYVQELHRCHQEFSSVPDNSSSSSRFSTSVTFLRSQRQMNAKSAVRHCWILAYHQYSAADKLTYCAFFDKSHCRRTSTNLFTAIQGTKWFQTALMCCHFTSKWLDLSVLCFGEATESSPDCSKFWLLPRNTGVLTNSFSELISISSSASRISSTAASGC